MNNIICWNESLQLIEYLHGNFKHPDYIFIDNNWNTVEIEYGNIFDVKHLCISIDNFNDTLFRRNENGEIDLSDVVESNNIIICRIIYFKNSVYLNQVDIPFNNGLDYICKKIKKFLGNK